MTLGAEDVANKQGKTPSNLADEAGHMECAAMIAMYRNNTSTSDAPPRRGMVSQHQARPVVLQVQHTEKERERERERECVCVCASERERARESEIEIERDRDTERGMQMPSSKLCGAY